MKANTLGEEGKLKSTYELMRINWRSKNNPTDLLCPLHRIAESSKLLWVLTSMECALGSLKERDFNIGVTKNYFDKKYDEAEAKIQSLVEVSEYHFLLFELAYQNHLAAFRAEQQIWEVRRENEKLKKQIEVLNKEKEF